MNNRGAHSSGRNRWIMNSMRKRRAIAMFLVCLILLGACVPDTNLQRQADYLKQTAAVEANNLVSTQTARLKATAVALEQTTTAAVKGTAVALEGTATSAIGSGFTTGYRSPIRGKVKIGVYRPGVGDHTGRDLYAVDYLAAEDLTVYPTLPGHVVFSEWNCEKSPGQKTCYGNVIVIEHGDGLYSVYTHLLDKDLPALDVDVGYDTVIGHMSDSGCAGCGVHLHFAVHKGKPGLTKRDALWLPSEPVDVWQTIPGLKDCFPSKDVCETTTT